VADGEAHDCWTTTEAALTRDLSPDLVDAWERLRETAAEFGEQRIYASHSSIMFSRKVCYFFVRPKRSFLEVIFFLGRPITSPRIKRVQQGSRTKFWHVVQIRHRDEVEAPFTDWLLEAYRLEDAPPKKGAARTKTGKEKKEEKLKRGEKLKREKKLKQEKREKREKRGGLRRSSH
jgi:hypothetical protein